MVGEGAGEIELSEGAAMVANRLRKNLARLKGWRTQKGVSCFRLYDADLPEFVAAIDVYTRAGDGQVFAHVQEYQAPGSIDADKAQVRLEAICDAVVAVLRLVPEQLALKTRSRAKGGSKYGRMDFKGETFTVLEGGARFEVNLFDYLDTGLFLDHRPVRMWLQSHARDKRVLNLFCYTATASVHAALGGASTTTSVDLSATYLAWAKRNFALNDIPGRHEFVQADVMRWLVQQKATSRHGFDLIFCDPPTFSNSKRADDFDVQRSHVSLLASALELLSPGGTLIFSNNFRRFRLDEQALTSMCNIEEISDSTIDRDFARNSRIHRTWRLSHRL